MGSEDTADDWAARLAGEYTGWMRPPDGDWEDLIGIIRISCATADVDSLSVTITTIEFGAWVGLFRIAQKSLEGETGQASARFFLEPDQPDTNAPFRLRGTIANAAQGTLFEILLTHT